MFRYKFLFITHKRILEACKKLIIDKKIEINKTLEILSVQKNIIKVYLLKCYFCRKKASLKKKSYQPKLVYYLND